MNNFNGLNYDWERFVDVGGLEDYRNLLNRLNQMNISVFNQTPFSQAQQQFNQVQQRSTLYWPSNFEFGREFGNSHTRNAEPHWNRLFVENSETNRFSPYSCSPTNRLKKIMNKSDDIDQFTSPIPPKYTDRCLTGNLERLKKTIGGLPGEPIQRPTASSRFNAMSRPAQTPTPLLVDLADERPGPSRIKPPAPAPESLPNVAKPTQASRRSLETNWRNRKYEDECERRRLEARELEKESRDRESARINRRIYEEENRRLRLHLEGLILERRAPPKPEFPELPQEAETLVASAWNRRAPHGEVFSRGFDVDIHRKDLLTLSGLEWLNDEVINFYLSMVCQRNREDPDLPKVYAFNTFFYPKLTSTGYASIKRWTKKVDIFSFDVLIVPVHLTAHWCLAIIDIKKKTITYFDSLLGNNDNCLNILREYLCQESLDKKKTQFDLSDWTSICPKDIPQQLNGSDCGMFACKFAEYATRNADFTFNQSHMPYFRKRMVYEICQKRLLE